MSDLPVQVLKVDSEHEPLALADGRVPPPEEVSVVLVRPELEDVAEMKVRVVRPVLVAAIFLTFTETIWMNVKKNIGFHEISALANLVVAKESCSL
jgi:hypothetical protein